MVVVKNRKLVKQVLLFILVLLGLGITFSLFRNYCEWYFAIHCNSQNGLVATDSSIYWAPEFFPRKYRLSKNYSSFSRKYSWHLHWYLSVNFTFLHGIYISNFIFKYCEMYNILLYGSYANVLPWRLSHKTISFSS